MFPSLDFNRWIENLFVISRALSMICKFISSNLERIGGALIILMMLVIVLEVTLRTFWGASTRVAFDVVGILLGCAVFLGLGEAYRNGAHVRIKSFVMHLPERVKDILGDVVLLATIVYSCFIFWYTLDLAFDSLRTGISAQTLIRFPLFPFQMVLPIGTFVFIMVLIVFYSASKIK